MSANAGAGRRPLLFVLLVFALTVPFYWLGDRQVLPPSFHLYAPAMVFASAIPVSLACLFLWREGGRAAVAALWRSVVDVRRIGAWLWWVPILLLMPAVMTATYLLTPLIGRPIADPRFPILVAPLLFIAFFIFAVGEEAGWSGYVIGGLQARWSALTSALVLGVAWAGWHVIPYLQAHHAWNGWVVWQCAGTVALRVLMVWIFNNTGRSVLAMALFHAMINESEFMYPNLGSYYDPLIPCLLLSGAAAVVVFLWGPATLARFRYARP